MKHILLLFPLQALGAVSHALRQLGLDGAAGAVGYWSSLWAIPGIGEAVGREPAMVGARVGAEGVRARRRQGPRERREGRRGMSGGCDTTDEDRARWEAERRSRDSVLTARKTAADKEAATVERVAGMLPIEHARAADYLRGLAAGLRLAAEKA